MNVIVKFASGFMGLFDTGAQTFIGWGQELYRKYYCYLF